jgi:hypothetical protein
MGRIALGKEDKLRMRLFYTSTVPVLVASLAVGYIGLEAVHSFLAGSAYERLAAYLWMAVFFVLFVLANQVFVVQPYRRAVPVSRKGGTRNG